MIGATYPIHAYYVIPYSYCRFPTHLIAPRPSWLTKRVRSNSAIQPGLLPVIVAPQRCGNLSLVTMNVVSTRLDVGVPGSVLLFDKKHLLVAHHHPASPPPAAPSSPVEPTGTEDHTSAGVPIYHSPYGWALVHLLASIDTRERFNHEFALCPPARRPRAHSNSFSFRAFTAQHVAHDCSHPQPHTSPPRYCSNILPTFVTRHANGLPSFWPQLLHFFFARKKILDRAHPTNNDHLGA